MNTLHTRSGFTFWQIAGAFACVLIIAAIVYPVFQRVPQGRHHGSCQSNMKQLGLAYVQYCQDYDEKFAPGVNAAGNGWAGKLYPYVKAVGCYHCPNDPATGSHISYVQNHNITGQSVNALAAPAVTVQLYETTTLNCDPSTSETVSATGLSPPQTSDRHDANTFGLNFLLTDGHVKYLLPGFVSWGPSALPTRKITLGGPSVVRKIATHTVGVGLAPTLLIFAKRRAARKEGRGQAPPLRFPCSPQGVTNFTGRV